MGGQEFTIGVCCVQIERVRMLCGYSGRCFGCNASKHVLVAWFCYAIGQALVVHLGLQRHNHCLDGMGAPAGQHAYGGRGIPRDRVSKHETDTLRQHWHHIISACDAGGIKDDQACTLRRGPGGRGDKMAKTAAHLEISTRNSSTSKNAIQSCLWACWARQS